MSTLRRVCRVVERVAKRPVPDRDPAQRIIVMYHGVAERRAFNCVTVDRFREQLEFVRLHYHVVPVTELIERACAPAPGDGPLLALTFDDAYENFLTTAYPVLHELKLPAGIAIPTGHVGGVNQWDVDRGLPPLGLMSWPQLRELDPHLVELGSHSVTHRSLGTLSETEARREAQGSKAAIEQETGRPAAWFAYPYGTLRDLHPAATSILEEAGYVGACSTHWGRFNGPADRYALRRIDVWEDDTLGNFTAKLSGGYDWLGPKETAAHAVRRLAGKNPRR